MRALVCVGKLKNSSKDKKFSVVFFEECDFCDVKFIFIEEDGICVPFKLLSFSDGWIELDDMDYLNKGGKLWRDFFIEKEVNEDGE